MLTRPVSAIVVAAALAPSLRAATVAVVPNLYNGKLPVISELMPDGKSIMGVAGDEVFRWTPNGGRVVLGSLGPRVLATAISADGSTVVGRRVSFSDQEAIRWTVGDGVTVLPRPADFPHNPFPTHVSDDGSIVYGTAHTHFTQPLLDLETLGEITNPDFPDIHTFGGEEGVFRWDNIEGTRTLPDWTSAPLLSFKHLRGISADGLDAGGIINRVPVIWNETGGASPPHNLPEQFFSSFVTDISADGNTVIGHFYPAQWTGHRHAFRYSKDEGFRPLTGMTETFSDTLAVSGNGEIILGRYEQQPGGPAFDFVWRSDHGIQGLVDYFADHGVNFPLHGNLSASQMSRDGLVFLVRGTQQLVGEDGSVEYISNRWIVNLTAVPEPSALFLFLAGILLSSKLLARRITYCRRA
jgi:hypothetical protein